MLHRFKWLLFIGTYFLISVSLAHAEAVLTISGAVVSPKFPKPGGEVNVIFTVRNTGNERTPGNTSLAVDIYSSDAQGNAVPGDYVKAIPWYQNNIMPLDPGASFEVIATADVDKAGRHTASATLITEGYSAEQVRVDNGTLKQFFNVLRPADLVLERMRLDSQGRLLLTMFNAGATIPVQHFNASTIRVIIGSRNYTVALRDGAPTELRKAGNRILGGPRRVFRWPTSGPQGIILAPLEQHTVRAIIDHNVSISDDRRVNNSKTAVVGGKPDLVVCFKKYNYHRRLNRNYSYPPKVKNIGNSRSGPSKLRFWIQDKGPKMYSIPPLNPGEEYPGVQRRVYWIRRKFHRFRLTVDFNKDVDEEGESNNIIEGSIQAGGRYTSHGNSPIKCSDQPGMTGF